MDERRSGPGRWAEQANQAAHRAAQNVDDTTGTSSQRAAAAISSAVRLLRWPTAALLVLSAPFVFATLVIGLAADGAIGWVFTAVGAAMALVAIAFAARRYRILQAVADPEALAAELRVMVNLTGRVQQTGQVLEDIAGGGGWSVLRRMKGLWAGANLPARWLDDVGELKRARYFAPPKIGTTVSLAIAAAWLVPISIVVSVLAGIGALAGSL
jgi:hypothetical protein